MQLGEFKGPSREMRRSWGGSCRAPWAMVKSSASTSSKLTFVEGPEP